MDIKVFVGRVGGWWGRLRQETEVEGALKKQISTIVCLWVCMQSSVPKRLLPKMLILFILGGKTFCDFNFFFFDSILYTH